MNDGAATPDDPAPHPARHMAPDTEQCVLHAVHHEFRVPSGRDTPATDSSRSDDVFGVVAGSGGQQGVEQLGRRRADGRPAGIVVDDHEVAAERVRDDAPASGHTSAPPR